MKAVIYARYSSDSQREESIEGQLRECTEYAERNGITVLRSYIDRALSARTADRPEFQNMIKDSEQKLFDVVLIWKLDRFSRDRYDSAHYKRILKKNGVKVISVKENISDGPEGIILESMLEGYAEYYSAELSEKIHRGQKENALKGRNNGGGIPLGYLLGNEQKLVLDPVTAPIVREIFQRYADGEIVRTIVEDFNRRGLKTKNGKPFSPNSFNRILKNRKYIGEYQYQDVIIPGGVPAILSDDLFYRVQARLEKNKRAPATAKADVDYLLTTKLFCGLCERMMIGESGTSHTGDKHYYYKCAGAKRKLGCKKKSVKKDFIERAAVILTVNRVLRDEEISRIADSILALQNSEDATIPALKKQLADTERGIENMLNAIQQGVLTSSTKERLEALEKQRDNLKIAVLQAELQKPKYTKEQIVSWIDQFKYGDVNSREYQKRIIDTFVNSLYLFDDRLVITYNFKGGTETITLKDVEAVYGSDLKAMSPPLKAPESLRIQALAFFVATLFATFFKSNYQISLYSLLLIASALALYHFYTGSANKCQCYEAESPGITGLGGDELGAWYLTGAFAAENALFAIAAVNVLVEARTFRRPWPVGGNRPIRRPGGAGGGWPWGSRGFRGDRRFGRRGGFRRVRRFWRRRRFR